MTTILEVNNLHYYYGEIHILKGIDLYIKEGEIVTIIGLNGAGKTTTLRCISGLLGTIIQGSIKFEGNLLNKVPSHKITSMGVCHVLEGRHIFPQLTVRENIMMGAYLRKRHENLDNDLEYIYSLFPVLKNRKKQLGSTLSGGEQQMLAIARALMGRPKILLMDEPSLGLAPVFVVEIFQVIRKINNNGISVLLVEQNSKVALSIAHRGYIMETGKIILSGDAKELFVNENVKKSYFGE